MIMIINISTTSTTIRQWNKKNTLSLKLIKISSKFIIVVKCLQWWINFPFQQIYDDKTLPRIREFKIIIIMKENKRILELLCFNFGNTPRNWLTHYNFSFLKKGSAMIEEVATKNWDNTVRVPCFRTEQWWSLEDRRYVRACTKHG